MKTDQLNIRLTERQHEAIRVRAAARFMDVTAYLLDLVKRDMPRDQLQIELTENGYVPEAPARKEKPYDG